MMQPQVSQSSIYPLPPKKSKAPIVIVALAVLLAASIVFGVWAFMKSQDYKNNSDQKSAAAVTAALKTEDSRLQAQFDAQSKQPYKTYTGSATYGSVTFNYPKTWSAYVDTTNVSEPINGYFYPDVVPASQSPTAFALRVELTTTDYASVLANYTSQITTGAVKASAYMPPKMNGVANAQPGTLLSGTVTQDNTQQGTMLVIKVRDKTLKIYTESTDFNSDFNSIILPSLTFAP